MKKKIALDLDGVVFNSEDLYRVYTEMYDVDVKKKDSIIDNRTRRLQTRYDWSREEIIEFFNKYNKQVLKESNIMPGAKMVIDRLKEYYDFIIITLRSEEEYNISKDDLKELGLDNVKTFIFEREKVKRCIEEKVDYIIEDAEINCIEASNNKITALYLKNNAADKLEENEYLVNVNNWGEIYKYLMLNDVMKRR